MFRYKIDILKALADNGYNTSRLRKDKIMSQAILYCSGGIVGVLVAF